MEVKLFFVYLQINELGERAYILKNSHGRCVVSEFGLKP